MTHKLLSLHACVQSPGKGNGPKKRFYKVLLLRRLTLQSENYERETRFRFRGLFAFSADSTSSRVNELHMLLILSSVTVRL